MKHCTECLRVRAEPDSAYCKACKPPAWMVKRPSAVGTHVPEAQMKAEYNSLVRAMEGAPSTQHLVRIEVTKVDRYTGEVTGKILDMDHLVNVEVCTLLGHQNTAADLESALRALVNALPLCSSAGCDATATTTLRFEEGGGRYYMDVLACAEHAHEGADPLTYADALRAALTLLGDAP